MMFFNTNARRIAALEEEVVRLRVDVANMSAKSRFSIARPPPRPLAPNPHPYYDPMPNPVVYLPLRDVLQAVLAHLHLEIEAIPAAEQECRLVPVPKR